MQINKFSFTLFELVVVVLLMGLVYSFGINALMSKKTQMNEDMNFNATSILSLMQTKNDGFSFVCFDARLDCEEYYKMGLLRSEVVDDIGFDYKQKFYIFNRLRKNAQEYSSKSVYLEQQKQLLEEASNSVF